MALLALIVSLIALTALVALLTRPPTTHALGEARERVAEWLAEFADWLRLGR
jgi:hypothetical protein